MKKYLTIFAVVVVCFIGVAGLLAYKAHATGGPQPTLPADLTGWAWSSNIGWISFNSNNPSQSQSQSQSFLFKEAQAQTSAPFKVYVDTNHDLVGYAWSSNIGWIKFGGLAGTTVTLDDGSMVVTTDAKVNLGTGAITGWVRACAGTATGDCSTTTSRSDGWDGWIELSGNKHPSPDSSGNSGVTLNITTGAINGFAWGGQVMGWINFNPAANLGLAPVSCPGCVPSNPTSFTITPSAGPGGSISPPNVATVNSGNNYSQTYTMTQNSGYQVSNVIVDGTSIGTPLTYLLSLTNVQANHTISALFIPTQASSSSGVQLWFDARPKPGSDSAMNNQSPVQITLGKSVPLDFYWDTTNISSCQGALVSGPDVSTTGWLSNKTLKNPPMSTFTAPSVGTYVLRLRCNDNATPTPNTVLSNTVKIIVTTSSVREI